MPRNIIIAEKRKSLKPNSVIAVSTLKRPFILVIYSCDTQVVMLTSVIIRFHKITWPPP